MFSMKDPSHMSGDGDSSSVFELVTRLSHNIVNQECPSASTLKVRKCLMKYSRSFMYGILLGKTHLKEVDRLALVNSHMDPMSCLISERHVLSCNGNQKLASDLHEAIQQALKMKEIHNINPIIRCLIALSHSAPSSAEILCFRFGSLTLSDPQIRGSGVQPYNLFSPDSFNPPVWMKISYSFSQLGEYVSTFPFTKTFGEAPIGLENFCLKYGNERPCSKVKSPLYKLKKMNILMEQKSFSLPLLQNFSHQDDEGYVTPATDLALTDHPQMAEESEDSTQFWSDSLHVNLTQIHSWETLGELVSYSEEPFISAAPSDAFAHHSLLANLYEELALLNQTKSMFELQKVSRSAFIRDALYLLVGVESNNFLYVEDKNCFIICPGLCLEGYSIRNTELLCEDFLYCGTHFRRLEKFSNYDSVQPENSSVACALKDSVWRWTQFYHGVVLALSSSLSSQASSFSMFELLEKVRILKVQAECLAQLCRKVDPKQSGTSLLADVYREASKSSPQLSHLLYSVLKSCCRGYLRCLEQWIFHGSCSDVDHQEFFVHSDTNFCIQRNRFYWTRGFVLNKSAVPDFLKGLENAFFDCGRAVNLLLFCNPHHPLCSLLAHNHPTLRCCLYKTDVEMVHKECTDFEHEVLQRCGEMFSIASVFEEEKKREAHLHNLIVKVQEERAVSQARLKEEQMKQLKDKKRKQHAELKAQMEADDKRKADEKRLQQLKDEQYLEECKRAEEVLYQRQENERQRLLAYYGSMNELIEKQEKHREWQMNRLKLADKRKEYILKIHDEENEPTGKSLDFVGLTSEAVTDFPVDLPVNIECKSITPSVQSLYPPSSGNDIVVAGSSSNDTESEEVASSKSEPDWKVNRQKVLGTQLDFSNTLSIENEQTSSVSKRDGVETLSDHLEQAACDVGNVEPEWMRNRRKVLGTEFGIACNSGTIAELKTPTSSESDQCSLTPSSAENGEEPEWKKNRRKVLDIELNMFSAQSQSHCTSEKKRVSCESDLEKNRRKILGGEFDILTGEKKPVLREASSALPMPLLFAKEVQCDPLFCEEIDVPLHVESEITHTRGRPTDLPLELLDSEPVVCSPSTTPHSVTDLPVFQSPFEGTNNLPHELILSSPLKSKNILLNTKVGTFPIMIDIMDRFSSKWGSLSENINDDSDKTSEAVSSDPNTAWLETSLQKCLLIPLRVQHRLVSAALLEYYFVDLRLLSHLKSLRSYYFMQDGEFGRHLTTKLFTTIYQVKTSSGLFDPFTLNKLLREALSSSQGTLDPNRCHLSLTVSDKPGRFSFFSPNVLDCLRLLYHVPWPLNLLLTGEAIEKYNLVFLFLVRLRRVAWLLQEDFITLKKTAHNCLKGGNSDLINSPQYHQVQIIRHIMSQFIQATLNYISSSVLHASWTDFEKSLKQAKTIDHIYSAHISYIKQLLKRCLLNNNSKRVEAVLSKVLTTILQFHSQLRVRPWQLPSSNTLSQKLSTVYPEHPNFKSLQSCFQHFKLQVCRLLSYMEHLVGPPNQQQHLADYILLLNINGFYRTSDYLQLAGKSTI